MAGKTFILEIVTPRKVVFNGEVESFSAPGIVGGFQVLYNHAPLLSATTVGEVKVVDAKGNSVRYATGGGFVEVKKNHVVMLADSAEKPTEIDLARAERAKERAEKRLVARQEKLDFDRARLALARAINRIRIAGRQ
ncbi:MAG: F0F1 ATP synthase subunit epsilon [Bacteroidota bacterium]